jgi:protein involved in polysaccharide export with SLBB domain
MHRIARWISVAVGFSIFTSTAFSQGKRTTADSSRFVRKHESAERKLPFSPIRPLQNYLDKSTGNAPTIAEDPSKKSSLSLFGIDLFENGFTDPISERADVYVLPPQYRLGPGDKISVFLLGKVQDKLDVLINVEGKAFVPPAGVLDVQGLSLEEFKTLLTQKLTRYYDHFTVDLMLLQPKNVLVAVVGDVVQPGKYVMSAMNTVLDAVILAGGPTEKGSMREVQVFRNDTLYAAVDLYQFLMNRQSHENDVYLEVNDRIFVPLMQSKVTIEGEIKRPALFELRPGGNERLSDLINLAGGFTEYAFEDKIEISRLEASGYRRLLYVNYRAMAAGDTTQNILLQNEDKVQVFSKLEQIYERTVAIFGEIRRPGIYPLEDDMRLSDLILKAGNLTRKAYTLEAEVAKIDPRQPTQFLKVSLENLNNGANGHTDILLEEDDQVFIRQIPEWEVGLTVDVQGEVTFPGRYSIVKDSTYLSEILQKAGGFTDEAFLQEAYVIRPSTRLKFDKEFERLHEMRREEMTDLEYQYFVMRQNTADVNHIVVDFEKLFYKNDHSQDVILEDGDIVVIPKIPKVVTVTGRVANPGGVTYIADANIKYYLAKVGGAAWDADLGKTKVIKVSGEVLDDEDIKHLQPGDIIWVPRKSDKKIWPVALQTISVMAQIASIYLIIDTAANR